MQLAWARCWLPVHAQAAKALQDIVARNRTLAQENLDMQARQTKEKRESSASTRGLP